MIRVATVVQILFALLFLNALNAASDPRRLHTADAPAWLENVGQLTVPGQKWRAGEYQNFEENCTATLLVSDTSREVEPASARYVISAWHCLEFYRDLSRPIAFSLPQRALERRASLVTSGGGMDADWALFRLDSAIAVPHPVTPANADTRVTEVAVTMAGYSRDLRQPNGLQPLGYHSGCQITASTATLITTNCRATKGASGGPVIAHQQGQVKLLGVVSVGDSRDFSLFVPTKTFLRQIRPYLRR